VVRLDPRWPSGRAALRRRRLWPSSKAPIISCFSLPLFSIPPAAPLVIIVTAVPRSAFDLADRLGVRLVPDAALVSAAGRDPDRHHRRRHGPGEHRQAATGKVGGAVGRRWIIAFAFGVVHGSASVALREPCNSRAIICSRRCSIQPRRRIGQLAVLLALVPALGPAFRYVVPERLGIIILSALVVHTAWH